MSSEQRSPEACRFYEILSDIVRTADDAGVDRRDITDALICKSLTLEPDLAEKSWEDYGDTRRRYSEHYRRMPGGTRPNVVAA
jgi:hypothetical protein